MRISASSSAMRMVCFIAAPPSGMGLGQMRSGPLPFSRILAHTVPGLSRSSPLYTITRIRRNAVSGDWLWKCRFHGRTEISRRYSFYISGSDQVWSPISAGFDPVYFLPFARDEQKLSYAASIGSTELNTDIKKELFSRLNGFQVLSVREESAKKLLMDADTNREIYVHPDPTLLIPREQWLKIASDPVVKEKYVLVFNVEKPIHDITYAKKLATEKNMKVVYLNDRTIRKDPDITYIEAPSPDEFLSLFANASAIVTNSFHGTVFSIIFQKEFYVELDNRKQRNIRVESLLTQLEIPTRSISEAQSDTEINWDNVERILRGKRENVEIYFNAMFGQKNKHE